MASRRASKLQAPAREFDDAEPSDQPRRVEFAASEAPSDEESHISVVSPRSPQPRSPPPDQEEDLLPDEAPCWVDPDEDPVEWLRHHMLYNSGDPFKRLTELWLETGQKGLQEEEEDLGEEDDEDAAKKAEKEGPSEAELKFQGVQQQFEASKGHLIWMRGRDLRAELVDQVERRSMQKSSSLAISSTVSYSSGATRMMKPTGSLNSNMGLCWWVAPRYPKNAKKSGAPQTRRKKTWCWRSDFVAEVLHAAVAMGMDYPVVDAITARGAVRHNPELAIALRHHVAVLSTDRQCKLWSPSFLQSLDVLRLQWKFGEEVRLEEVELMANYPEAIALFAKKKQPEHSEKEMRMRVPPALLKARREPPLVVVPDRLPTRLAYDSEQLGLRRLGSQGSLLRRMGSQASSLQRMDSRRSLASTPGMQRMDSRRSLASGPGLQRMDSRRSLASGPGVQSAGRLAMRPPSAGRRRLERSTSDLSAATAHKRVSFSKEVVGPLSLG